MSDQQYTPFGPCRCHEIDYLAVPPWDKCRPCNETSAAARRQDQLTQSIDRLVTALADSAERRQARS